MFADRFQLILMGFLTTSLHKNSQNDVKLLETWWFWHILGKGTHIYSNQKHPDFHQKSPWTPMSKLSPVWGGAHQILADQLTLSQTWGCTLCPTHYYMPPRPWFLEPSYSPGKKGCIYSKLHGLANYIPSRVHLVRAVPLFNLFLLILDKYLPKR